MCKAIHKIIQQNYSGDGGGGVSLCIFPTQTFSIFFVGCGGVREYYRTCYYLNPTMTDSNNAETVIPSSPIADLHGGHSVPLTSLPLTKDWKQP